MKSYLEKDVFVFSGLKTHAQLTEARSLLKDEKGNIRPYHLFEQDVLKLNEKYNRNYLDAEYQFAVSSSQSAANWANLSDNERYNLQYRTAGDERVRESHVALNRITLPKKDAFWISYYPPNGWRCRCIAVLVLASKYPATDVKTATEAGEKATTQIGKNGKNKLEMFRFNPGMEKRVFPKENSYNPKHCDGTKLSLTGLIGHSVFVLNAENERCKAKKIIENLADNNVRKSIKNYDNGGIIKSSGLVNNLGNDYKSLYECCDFFAKKGNKTELLPTLHPNSSEYLNFFEKLIGTNYEGKSPDILRNGKYYEHEGFNTNEPKNALKNMLNRGQKQSSNIIIEACGLTDKYIKHNIIKRVKEGQIIDEVWIKEGKILRKIFSKDQRPT